VLALDVTAAVSHGKEHLADGAEPSHLRLLAKVHVIVLERILGSSFATVHALVVFGGSVLRKNVLAERSVTLSFLGTTAAAGFGASLFRLRTRALLFARGRVRLRT